MFKEITEEFLKDRIIYISGEVNVEMSDHVIQLLLYLDKKAPGKEIKIYINSSPGGQVRPGIGMIDTIRTIKSPVSVVAIGYVASMASVLLSCGDKGKRFIQKGAQVMIHQVSSGIGQSKNEDIQVMARNTDNLNKYLIGLLAENCGKTYEEVQNDCRTDYWMTAEEAVKYGIVDEIIMETDKSKTADNQVITEADLDWEV